MDVFFHGKPINKNEFLTRATPDTYHDIYIYGWLPVGLIPKNLPINHQ